MCLVLWQDLKSEISNHKGNATNKAPRTKNKRPKPTTRVEKPKSQVHHDQQQKRLRMLIMLRMISRADLKAKIDRRDDFSLIDVLPETAYQHAHLPRAINIPSDRIRELAPELLPNRQPEIVVYCSKLT